MSTKGAILAVNKKLMDVPSHDQILSGGLGKVSAMELLRLCVRRTVQYDDYGASAAARLAEDTMREIEAWYYPDFQDTEDWWANLGIP